MTILLETKAAITGWALTSKRPSMLLLVLTNSFFWAILLAAGGNSNRGAMLALDWTLSWQSIVPPMRAWAAIWALAFLYQLFSSLSGNTKCAQIASALVAGLNIFCLLLMAWVLWPDLPALLAGSVCVTTASILLFVSGERRANRKQKGERSNECRREDD